MRRYVESQDRQQVTLLPECLDDFIAEDNPVRIVDAFVNELDLGGLGFAGMMPASTGRPSYPPGVLLKIYIYGYLNRVQSSRRLERECQRNVELMWLTGRLAPDFKTIADFRRDNGHGIRQTCSQFVAICRKLKLLADGVVAVDGSKFKAVNNRDRNFTPHQLEQRMKQIQESIDRYLQALDDCPMKAQCTPASFRRIRRWEHEDVLDDMQQRLDRNPNAMKIRRRTVEHVFGTLKHWMGSTHFLMKTLRHVPTEVSLHVLAYNLKRLMSLLGIAETMKAMRFARA